MRAIPSVPSKVLGFIYSLSLITLDVSAQTLDPQENLEWRNQLRRYADQISEAPTPPPQYLRRRWRWSESLKSPAQRAGDTVDSGVSSSMLEQLQRELWARLGQATSSPLYESPQARDERRAEMDLETRGTPLLPTYTHEFIPAVYPHKRMTSWNMISEQGALEVNIGSLTEIESVEMSEVLNCIQGSTSNAPSQGRSLALAEGVWVKPQQLDLECFREECLRQGTACFIGVFSTQDWNEPTSPRGIASVSPEQSLVSVSSRMSLILSQDDAGNFYLSSLPGTAFSSLKKLSVLISAPRSYFSGTWRSPIPIKALSSHPDLELPKTLKREALYLSSQLLNLRPDQSYESMIYRLSEYFRSFSPGEISSEHGSIYKTLMMHQIGVCRHRSYAFMITARALGIPTRYVTNQVHAFVEVLDPNGRWRRVDLGGEGIAPEDTHLTENAQPESDSMTDRLYRPDDGLPRPQAYLNTRAELPKKRDELMLRKATTEDFREPSENPKPESTDHRLRADAKNEQSAEGKDLQSGIATEELSDENRGEVIEEPSDERRGDAMHERSEELSVVLSGEQSHHSETIHTTLEQIPTAACASSTLPILEPSDRSAQERWLNELDSLLARPREDLLKGSVTQVSLKDPKLTRIHRCDTLELRGRVKWGAKVRAQQSRQRGRNSQKAWVIAAIKSTTDGQTLMGWGRLDRGGSFRFKAQIPPMVKPGDYQLFVYFPEQLGFQAGWSELER